MKKITVSLLASSLLFGAGVYAGNSLEPVQAFKNPFPISINGQNTTFEHAPLLYNNATYLPLSELSSKLGLSVHWNEKDKKVEIGKIVADSNTSGTVVTANEGGSLTFLNLATHKKHELPLTGSVHNVQVAPDGKTVWATVVPKGGHAHQENTMPMSDHMNRIDEGAMTGQGHMTDDMHEQTMPVMTEKGMLEHAESMNTTTQGQNGKLIVIDLETAKVIKEMNVGAHPAHVVLTSDGKYTLVTDSETNHVTIVDAVSFQKMKDVPVGQMPHGMRISADGKWAYIANMGGSTVSVVDIEKGTEVKQIEVGKTPVQVGLTKDGKTLTATLNAENSLAIVDLSSGNVKKVKVGNGPAQVYVDPTDSFAYVANQGTADSPSDTVSKVDINSGKEIYRVKTGAGPHGVTTSEDGKYVMVTNMYAHTMTVFEAETGKIITNEKVGETPNGITFIR